jgi:PIN domain nuclease of toxin-antitoxin system
LERGALRLLLDTHVVLWWIWNRPFSDAAMAAIADQGNEVVVSAVTAWEIAIKKELGKLDVPGDLEAQLARHGFGTLSISVSHATTAGALPPHNRDPFDRMLVAQAMIEGLQLVTGDPRLARYGVPVVPA